MYHRKKQWNPQHLQLKSHYFIHVNGKQIKFAFHEGVKIRRQLKDSASTALTYSQQYLGSVDWIDRTVIWIRERVLRVRGNIFSVSQLIQQIMITKESGSMEFVGCENVPMITIVHNFLHTESRNKNILMKPLKIPDSCNFRERC